MSHSRGALVVASILFVGGMTAPSRGEESPPRQSGTSTREVYRIDASKSRFLVETETARISAMFVHDHKIEVGDFSGIAGFTRGALSTGFLTLTVKPASLHLIEEKVGDNRTIETALLEDVLETARYPELSFKSRSVTSARRGDGTYDVRLTGQLLLHGVRRQVTIPARVSLEPGVLHAIGVFQIRQSDFRITPFSFLSGSVTVKDTVTISFDIVAKQPDPRQPSPTPRP